MTGVQTCALPILLATQPWSSLFVSHYEGCELIEAEFPKSAALALALGFIPSIMGAAAFRSRRLRALVHNAGPIASSLVICGLCALALTAVIFARDGEAPAGMIATTSVPILLSNILCWALASRFAPITDDRIAVASEAT